MADLRSVLAGGLGDGQAAFAAIAAGVADDRARLPVVFPGLPRQLGRQPARAGRFTGAGIDVNFAAWRRCDAAAALLLLDCRPDDARLWELYAHGDLEERAMLLRALAVLPITAGSVRLLGEVQRTNMVLHVEAAVCDSDLLHRAKGQHGFGQDEFNRMLLKLAFLDLPLGRAFGAEAHANAELSRMLQDLATEREAAGRAVWRDTGRLIGRAPAKGTAARLVGGLEHGDDGIRLSAVEGLRQLGRADLLPFARERLGREQRPEVQAALQALLD